MSSIDDIVARARSAWAAGDHAACRQLAAEALDIRRDDFTARMLLGDVCAAAGDLPGAARWMELAVASQPRNAGARLHLGRTLVRLGEARKAMRQFERVRRDAPADPGAAAGLASCHEMLGQPAKAEAALAPAMPGGVERAPLEVAATLARIRARTGAEANTLVESIAARFVGEVASDPSSNAADDPSSDPSSGPSSEPASEPARHAASRPARDSARDAAGSPRDRRTILHALARTREAAGDHAGAFAAATSANRLDPPDFDPDVLDASVDALIARATPERFAGMPRPETRDDRPVFIVGMPRCGSTLLERVLHAHPAVHGVGEAGTLDLVPSPPLAERLGSDRAMPELLDDLTPEATQGLRRDLLAWIRRAAPAAKRVVNKELFNLFRLELIAAVVPEARIIHCVRSPRDTALSCYMEQLPRGSCGFTCDREHLVRWWQAQHRLAEHMAGVLPNPWLEVRYEDLVADLPGQGQRVLSFLGLPWDDRCLEFHTVKRTETTASVDQVRRPLYRGSVQRSERFAAHLGPLAKLPAAMPGDARAERTEAFAAD
ncbi:MAG: sulfotransferase [Phycisphaerales bacterium]